LFFHLQFNVSFDVFLPFFKAFHLHI
jgi:hypothetical protein